MKEGSLTQFGKEHGLKSNTTYSEFKNQVPVRTYETFKPYIDRSLAGEESVTWPGMVKWFAKSSGTTSNRSKFIPVTKDSLEECHYKGGKDLLAIYCDNNPNAQLYKGKYLVMGGSSELSQLNANAITGDLSAIIIENLPIWVELRRTPNKDIALMDNWEEKIEKMARATMVEDVSIVAGVPSWTLVLFKKILEISGASSIKEVWPNFELYMHGGVSFKPYRNQFEQVVNAP
ncbi:MAG: GH3 auxin-responsive promoter family protein, partial [Bacteroidota bacterium]